LTPLPLHVARLGRQRYTAFAEVNGELKLASRPPVLASELCPCLQGTPRTLTLSCLRAVCGAGRESNRQLSVVPVVRRNLRIRAANLDDLHGVDKAVYRCPNRFRYAVVRSRCSVDRSYIPPDPLDPLGSRPDWCVNR